MSKTAQSKLVEELASSEEIDFGKLNTLAPHQMRRVLARHEARRHGSSLIKEVAEMILYVLGIKRSC